MKYKTELIKKFFEKGKVGDCPIYDIHGHMGPFSSIYFPYTEPEEMVKRMDRAGIKMQLFCHHSALFTPELSNKKNIEAVEKCPDRLRAYCGINPNYPDIIEKELKTFEKYKNKKIYIGFKFLSDYHQIPITDSRYKPVWEYADKEGLPILIHTWGGSSYDGEKLVREIAKKYHKVIIFLGHSLHGKWDEAVKIAKEFSNTYLDLTAVLDNRGILEKFVEGAGSERILFGTDFNWFNHHYYIGSILV